MLTISYTPTLNDMKQIEKIMRNFPVAKFDGNLWTVFKVIVKNKWLFIDTM